MPQSRVLGVEKGAENKQIVKRLRRLILNTFTKRHIKKGIKLHPKKD